MKRNYLIGFAIAAAVLFLLAFAVWSLFEIYPRTSKLPPSREARVNEYLALDRWLQGSGIPVRVENSGNLSLISYAEEKHIFIQSSLFRWTDEVVEYLVDWIEEGGSLFLVLDNSQYFQSSGKSDDPMMLLEEFGIKAETEAAVSVHQHEGESPSYDRRVFFEVQNDEAMILKDGNGLTRLVQLKRGKGTLTVTGRPLFLLSSNLDAAPNARLAWGLFAADKEAWLFIRGTTKVRGLFGSLFRQGNLPVLLVPVLVLLVIGFWAVIPMFGLVRRDEEKPGRPLRERFLAEGRFLSSYRALDFYRAVYVKEIRQRLARKENLAAEDEIEWRRLAIMRLLDIFEKPEEQDFFLRALHGEAFKNWEFSKFIVVLKTILERI